MREIEFRAYDRQTNKIIYNIELNKNQYTEEVLNCVGVRQIGANEIEHYPYQDIELMPYSFEGFLKDPRFEVMQFTGLYDKNGNKIWENDLLDSQNDNIYFNLIKWNSDECKFEILSYGLDCGNYGNDEVLVFDKDHITFEQLNNECAIIGNIFDNPELLKGE